jgi:hypothetical protein
VTVEKTIVFVDRTRPGVDAAVAESLRRHLSGEGGIDEAIQRGNGLELSVYRLSTSVFADQPLVVSFPPPKSGEDPELLLRLAKQKIDEVIAAFVAVPMGKVGARWRGDSTDTGGVAGVHGSLFPMGNDLVIDSRQIRRVRRCAIGFCRRGDWSVICFPRAWVRRDEIECRCFRPRTLALTESRRLMELRELGHE